MMHWYKNTMDRIQTYAIKGFWYRFFSTFTNVLVIFLNIYLIYTYVCGENAPDIFINVYFLCNEYCFA